MPKPILTQEKIKELLHYNPDTGIFAWTGHGRKNKHRYKVAGTLGKRGYIRIQVNGNICYAHRLAFLYMVGHFPPLGTDHLNGIKDDNRWENLKPASAGDNSKNHFMHKDNTSGVTGVYWHKGGGKWSAAIVSKGNTMHLGLFKEKFDAICARKAAEYKYNFSSRHGTPL